MEKVTLEQLEEALTGLLIDLKARTEEADRYINMPLKNEFASPVEFWKGVRHQANEAISLLEAYGLKTK